MALVALPISIALPKKNHNSLNSSPLLAEKDFNGFYRHESTSPRPLSALRLQKKRLLIGNRRLWGMLLLVLL
jgi:hypothetical protein